MVKVWKTTGAVRIDSVPRALGALAAVTLVILAAGFLIGRATQSSSADVSSPSPAPAAPSHSGSVAAARRAAFKDGFRRGQAAAARRRPPAASKRPAPPAPKGAQPKIAGAPDLQAGQIYVVKIAGAGSSGATTVGRHIQVRPGFSYSACNGGTAICESPGR